MDMKLIKKLVTPTIMMGWALYYFIEIQGKNASAGLFIRPVFWIMLVLYLMILWMDTRDWRGEKRTQASAAQQATAEEKQAAQAKTAAEKADLRRTVICVGSAVAYVFLLPYLGFIISTVLFLFGLFCWLKAPNKLIAFVLALAVALGMYALFKIGLKVPLPTGLLGFI